MVGLPPPLLQRRVFVDSSAYLALLDADDPDHRESVEILTRLAEQRYRLYTSNIILIEAHALILSTLGIAAAGRFLRGIAGSRTVVVRVRVSDEERARQILFQYADKDFLFRRCLRLTRGTRWLPVSPHIGREGREAIRAGWSKRRETGEG